MDHLTIHFKVQFESAEKYQLNASVFERVNLISLSDISQSFLLSAILTEDCARLNLEAIAPFEAELVLKQLQ